MKTELPSLLLIENGLFVFSETERFCPEQNTRELSAYEPSKQSALKSDPLKTSG